jgi:mannose-6-phosphate isomerase-like protein (cupin superfamily)
MSTPMLALLVFFTLSPVVTFAQSNTKPNKATDISNEEIDAVLKKSLPKEDQQLKVVDVGRYNLAVGIIHRESTKDPTDGTTPCLAHHEVTEIYIIRAGVGTLVTGGTIINPKEVADGGDVNVKAVGPTVSGSIRNSEAQVRQVKPGDIIIIPADVCHGWFGIKDHVDYLSVRPDPDRLLPAGYVNPTIKK